MGYEIALTGCSTEHLQSTMVAYQKQILVGKCVRHYCSTEGPSILQTACRMIACNLAHWNATKNVCVSCRSQDFYRILTEPENNMLKQQQALMETEGIQMEFTDAAIREISRVAEEVRPSIFHLKSKTLVSMQSKEQQLCILLAKPVSVSLSLINKQLPHGCAVPYLQSSIAAHPNPDCNVVPGEHIC